MIKGLLEKKCIGFVRIFVIAVFIGLSSITSLSCSKNTEVLVTEIGVNPPSRRSAKTSKAGNLYIQGQKQRSFSSTAKVPNTLTIRYLRKMNSVCINWYRVTKKRALSSARQVSTLPAERGPPCAHRARLPRSPQASHRSRAPWQSGNLVAPYPARRLRPLSCAPICRGTSASA